MVATNYVWNPVFDCITKETSDAGAVTVRYTQEPKLYGGLISQHRSGATSIYHYDAIGTTRALTDSSQNVTDTAVYTAFGEKAASVGTTMNPFGFVGAMGYYANTSTNRVYVRARNYSPQRGRWISRDPLYVSGLSKAGHEFTYAGNRLTVAIDPSGLVEITIIDPHTKRKVTFPAGTCRSKDELKAEQGNTASRRPAQTCIFEECYTRVQRAWNSGRVKACRDAVDDFAEESNTKCREVIDGPPVCDLQCQYLALYFPQSHSIRVCADRVLASDEALESILCHELLHARQSATCRPVRNPYQTPDRCQNSLRKELQAYFCTAGCTWFEDCLARALRSACPASCDPGGTPKMPSQAQIDELYRWANQFVSQGTFCPTQIRGLFPPQSIR